jgi:hypothetical protein
MKRADCVATGADAPGATRRAWMCYEIMGVARYEITGRLRYEIIVLRVMTFWSANPGGGVCVSRGSHVRRTEMRYEIMQNSITGAKRRGTFAARCRNRWKYSMQNVNLLVSIICSVV